MRTRAHGPAHRQPDRFVVAVALAVVVGAVLAFLAGGGLACYETRAMQTTVDGWSSGGQCGQPGSNILVAGRDPRSWLAAG